MSIALSVNLNKIALIRNSRPGNNPNLLQYAKRCIAAGADGITVHPRPDQRHIRPEDCYQLACLQKTLATELNIEGNPFEEAQPAERDDFNVYPGFMSILRKALPAQATLVPDQSQQLTSDHGFDLNQQAASLQPIIEELKQLNIRVSLFMDPEISQIDLAKKIGADRIELYTGPYASTFEKGDDKQTKKLVDCYFSAAKHAQEIGLGVNAGHDLNLDNLSCLTEMPGLLEVSIGHAITIDALDMGLNTAINAYQQKLKQ